MARTHALLVIILVLAWLPLPHAVSFVVSAVLLTVALAVWMLVRRQVHGSTPADLARRRLGLPG